MMWIVLTIGLILLLLLLGVLITPIVLFIDTDQNRYEVRQLPAFRISFDIKKLSPQLKLLGIPIPIKWNSQKSKEGSIEKEKQAVKKSNRKGFSKSWRAWKFLVTRAVESFRVKRFVVLVDTDDVVWNAQLTPLFLLASQGPCTLQTNYNGRMYCTLEASLTPGRLLWIFILFLTKK
ncbi:MAG: hypothetical protein MUE95_08585 [Cyclobacteriaceae bacterium]|jgi:hypothetical protein|nr:hypothetical protein [Cyclobacteriaceae bacterium]